MSGYPPGVTGNEWQIAGGRPVPRYDARCSNSSCGFEGQVDAEYANQVIWWECPACGREHEDEPPERDEDDL